MRFMTNAITAAKWLCKIYHARTNATLSEMTLHKLLYLSQRESLIRNENSPLFAEPFEAWKYGPVMKAVRARYSAIAENNGSDAEDASEEDVGIMDFVVGTYSNWNPWSLVNLTHGESSWIKARGGCGPDDHSSNEIRPEDILVDARRVRKRRELAALAG